jgi:hypothetical protein
MSGVPYEWRAGNADSVNDDTKIIAIGCYTFGAPMPEQRRGHLLVDRFRPVPPGTRPAT